MTFFFFSIFFSICLKSSGGEDRGGSFNFVECYDPKTEQWSFVTGMKRRRAGAGVTVCDGKIYVAGKI